MPVTFVTYLLFLKALCSTQLRWVVEIFLKTQFSTTLETLMATPTDCYVQIFCCSYQMPMQAECSEEEEETFTSYKCVPLLQSYNSHFLSRLYFFESQKALLVHHTNNRSCYCLMCNHKFFCMFAQSVSAKLKVFFISQKNHYSLVM